MGQSADARFDPHRPSRRLAPAPARRRRPRRRAAAQRPPVRAGDRHAEPPAAGRPGRAGARLPPADPRGLARRRVVRAADDALPDRQHPARRDAPGARGRHPGDQALSRRRHHQQRRRRHRPEQGRPGAGGGRARGRDPAGARRGDRSRGRRVRPRGGLHRAPPGRPAAQLSGTEDRARARHHEAGRRVRRRSRRATPRRRSPRTTCSTTATPCSPAACGRTGTACRS